MEKYSGEKEDRKVMQTMSRENIMTSLLDPSAHTWLDGIWTFLVT